MERPWHASVTGTFATLWGLALAADYLLVKLEIPAYLALFGAPLVDYFITLPTWVSALWGGAVWSGLLGALCLWSGVRGAAVWLAIAAILMGAFALWLLVYSDPPMQDLTGPLGLGLILGTMGVQLLLWLYARTLHARGAMP